MRSAEMYLIAAEALAREGRLEEAVKPLNTLRNARGLADSTWQARRRNGLSMIFCWNVAANCGVRDSALPIFSVRNVR